MEKQKSRRRLNLRTSTIFVVSVLALGLGGFVYLTLDVEAEVMAQAEHASTEFGLEPVSALSALVDSNDRSFADRNRAVWSLGELRDARATEILEGWVTGDACDHGTRLCEKELAKAIRKIAGEIPDPYWWYRDAERKFKWQQ